jgi:hypothetical protein
MNKASDERSSNKHDINELVEMFKDDIERVLPWNELLPYIPVDGNVTELFSGGAEGSLIGFSYIVGEHGKVLAVDLANMSSDYLPENTKRLVKRIPDLDIINTNSQDVVYIGRFETACTLWLQPDEMQTFKKEVLRIIKGNGHLILKDYEDDHYFNNKGKKASELVSELFGETMQLEKSVSYVSYESNTKVLVYKKIV